MNRRIFLVVAALSAVLVPLTAFAQGAPGGEATPVDHLSDFALWAMLGGAITSGATALINQSHWKSTTKLGVFLALCMVTAGIDAYIKRELDFQNWSRALLVVAASGWATYLATRPAIKQFEAATTVTRPV